MGPAQYYEPAATTKRICQPVNMAGIGGVTGDADQVGRGVEVDVLIVFIDQGNMMGRADEAGQVRHGELREVIELASSKGLDEAVFGSDQ